MGNRVVAYWIITPRYPHPSFRCHRNLCKISRADILFRLWVPSGRLAGPIANRFFCFLTEDFASPSYGRLTPILEAAGCRKSSESRYQDTRGQREPISSSLGRVGRDVEPVTSPSTTATGDGLMPQLCAPSHLCTQYSRLPRGRAGASGRDILFRRVTRRVGQYRFGGTSDFISSD